MSQKFEDIADTISPAQWGFEPEALEHLRKTRHRAVAKAVPASTLKEMPKKELARIGRLLGPSCDTVTQTMDWVRSTHLGTTGVPKNVQHPKKTKSDDNQENGNESITEENENVQENKMEKDSKTLEREQKIAAILKAKGVGKRQQKKMNKNAKKKMAKTSILDAKNPMAKKKKKVDQLKVRNIKNSKKANKAKNEKKKKAS